MRQEPLLSISEASQLLSVSEGALRQWTDEGKVKAFITPGGHRRYDRTDLKKFQGSHPRILGVKDLVIELEETVRDHREIARQSLNRTKWYVRLDGETLEHLADLGRRMLNLIIRYVTEPSQRADTILLIKDVGCSHGETLARLKLPLTDSVEAFLMHRGPIMRAVSHLMRKRKAFTGRIVEAIPMVVSVMDEALIALVSAHQEYRSEIPKDRNGSTTP